MAQPPGTPHPHSRPDHRDQWQRESDWIWRSSKKNLYRHHPHHPYPYPPVTYGGSGYMPFYPFLYPSPYGPHDPYGPTLYDPGCPRGQHSVPPAAGTGAAGEVPSAQLDAPSPERGRVDPGSRRYVSRWQRSGRGYIHVYGWEWTANGVPQQHLNRAYVDRSELADPMMLETVPSGETAEPTTGNHHPEPGQAVQDRGRVDSLFQSLDLNGDGKLSPEEFRASGDRR
jgi:hypothetical protein